MRSHYLLIFYSFCISFSVSLSSLPLHLFFLPPQTSITDLTSPAADPFLHCRSHKPNRCRPFSPLSISQAQLSTLFSIVDLTSCRPFSPSSISQAQPPQTLLSIADLTSPATTNPSILLCTHSVSIKKDQAMLLAAKSSNQYQLGLDSSMKTVKLCPLAQVSSVGTKTDRVSGMGFGLAVLIFMGFCFVVLHWF